MDIQKLTIPSVLLIKPRVFSDERGYFMEAFNHNTFKEQTGLDINFVQDNESKSSYGVLRGLHFQSGPMAQAKLVRVVKGEVLDVAVDIRPDSPTYGQHVSARLSEENKHQLFVPRGFAHGFVVLSEEAIFCYKCDNFYSKEHDGGIKFDDPALGIDWIIPKADLIISEKDQGLPSLEEMTKDELRVTSDE
jgi:dTDP-4-dehydrorhamnose 3,5-epimerase